MESFAASLLTDKSNALEGRNDWERCCNVNAVFGDDETFDDAEAEADAEADADADDVVIPTSFIRSLRKDISSVGSVSVMMARDVIQAVLSYVFPKGFSEAIL